MVTNCQTTNEHIVHALRLFVCRSSHKVSTRSLWSLGRSMLARIIKNNHSPQHLPTSAPADSLRRLRSRYTFLARRSRHSSRPCPLVKGSFSPSGSTLPSPERGVRSLCNRTRASSFRSRHSPSQGGATHCRGC